jgi:protein disulfide-isomerase A1
LILDEQGGRTQDTIVSWINKRLGPAAKKIQASEVASFGDASNVAVVGFFASETDAAFKAYETVATSLDEVPFAVCFDAEAAKANSLESGAGVVLFKKFDERKNVLNGAEVTSEEIKTFVESNRMPLVVPFTMEAAGKIFQVRYSAILCPEVVILPDSWSESRMEH